MRQVNNKYSKYFSYKYKRVGHVFNGVYRSTLIQDERYRINLIGYVHQNPLNVEMCASIVNYKWSSDAFYRTSNNSFTSIDVVLDMVSTERKEVITKYREYMKQEQTNKLLSSVSGT